MEREHRLGNGILNITCIFQMMLAAVQLIPWVAHVLFCMSNDDDVLWLHM